MSAINRDKDISEKKEWINWNNDYGLGVSNLVQTGQTFIVGGPMPYLGSLQSGYLYAAGTSGSMQLALSLQRFVPGGGYTSITVGISNLVLRATSSSGVLGLSGLPALGSTLLNFLQGDVFMMTTSGANTAVASLAVNLVVQKTEDIVTFNKVQG